MKPNFHHSQQPVSSNNISYQQTSNRTVTSQSEFIPQQQYSPQRTQQVLQQQQQQPKVYSSNGNLTALKQQAHAQMMMSLKPGSTHMQQQHQVIGHSGGGYQQSKHAEQLKLAVGKQEFCPHNSRYVGYLPGSRELVCNSDIFDKKLASVKFTALVCKQLRVDYNNSFNEYKKGLNQVNGVDPNIVKQRATILVQKYFSQLREKISTLKLESMQKIQSSESLRELEKIIESSREFFPDPQKGDDHFEREKRLFDEKIGKSRFAYLVKRQDFYQELIQSLDSNRSKMKVTLDRSQDQMSRIVKMNTNEAAVRQKITDIVHDCVDVDMKGFEAVDKRQNSTTQSNNSGLSHSPQRFQSENSSMRAQQSSQINSSMQRNSLAQFSSVQQQNQSPTRVQDQQNGFFNLDQQRQAGSPKVQQANFSPINRNPVPLSSTPPQQVSPNRAATSPLNAQQTSQLSNHSKTSSQKEGNESEDCVIVTNVVQPSNSPFRQEHSFRTTHKLKGQCLLKLVPGKGWAKMRETKDLFLSKCVQTLDDSAFIIGGSRDRQSQSTISDVVQYTVKATGVITQEIKAPMLTARSSHGCVVNVHTNEIYVAGGYHEGKLTRSCEAYSVKNNQWKQLPPLNEEKCSSSLCVLNGRYLYCFGGLTKQENAAYLLSSIEMLDLEQPNPKWLMLSIKMPHQVCDMGAIPLNDTDMLLFGGWNKQALTAAFIMKQNFRNDQPIHSFAQVNGSSLDKQDFFMISGVAMKTNDPSLIKVCGHTSLFTFDLKKLGFVGSSSM